LTLSMHRQWSKKCDRQPVTGCQNDATDATVDEYPSRYFKTLAASGAAALQCAH